MTDGLAKLRSLLQQVPSTSHTHADSSGYGLRRNTSLHGVCSKDLATVSALKSSFSFQPGDFHSGMNEWMKQFNQSASTFFQSTTGEEEFPHLRSAQRNYTMQCNQEDNIMIDRMKNWDNVKESHDLKAHPLTSISYPRPKLDPHKERYSSQRKSSRYPNEPKNSNQMPSPSCSSGSSRPRWLQQPDYLHSNPDNLGSSFFSGGSSHQDYHEQNAQLDYVMGGSSSDFITNIMNQIRGHDVATLESMLQQLLPHYPDLQSKCMEYFYFQILLVSYKGSWIVRLDIDGLS